MPRLVVQKVLLTLHIVEKVENRSIVIVSPFHYICISIGIVALYGLDV